MGKKRPMSEVVGTDDGGASKVARVEDIKRNERNERDENDWVSPTQIANAMLNDHLSDWLKLYGEVKEPETPDMLQFLFSQGHTFEDKLIKGLQALHPIVFIASRYRKELVTRTLNEMKKGTPIIWGAPLASQKKHIYGVADLLVRSDYLSNLVPGTVGKDDEVKGCTLHKDYHYVVIDVKFSTLPLRADGTHLLNQDRYKAYKAQVWMYTQMVGEMQGYYPTVAYIMGRGYTYVSKGVSYRGNTAFEKVATVDFSGVDSDVPSSTMEAIQWIRSLRKNGRNWTREDHPELYPNMKADSIFNPQKKEIAEQIGEITQLWYCGVEQREIAHSKGVKTWKDPRFTAELVGMKNQRALTLNQMLTVNRGKDGDPVMLPQKITRMKQFLNKMNREFFVDFEILTGVFDNLDQLPRSNPINMIFMISAAWFEPASPRSDGGPEEAKLCCTTFCVDNLSLQSEAKMMREFLDFIGKDSELYHWADAEPIQWAAALRRHPDKFVQDGDTLKDRWTDILWLFTEEPITIKGCFSYSLKEVMRALKSLGLVECEWTSEVTAGDEAMIHAYRELSAGRTIETSKVLQDIAMYNQIDCIAISEVVDFLRTRLA